MPIDTPIYRFTFSSLTLHIKKISFSFLLELYFRYFKNSCHATTFTKISTIIFTRTSFLESSSTRTVLICLICSSRALALSHI